MIPLIIDIAVLQMFSGLILASLLYGALLFFVIYRHNKRDSPDLFKHEHQRFLDNMHKLDLDDDVMKSELSKIETYEDLRRRNKQIEQAIKKYNL